MDADRMRIVRTSTLNGSDLGGENKSMVTDFESVSAVKDTENDSGRSELSTPSNTPFPLLLKQTTVDTSDSDSDLSSLGDTPPPPTPPQSTGRPEAIVKIECTHTDWCDCPMHASHISGARIPHLSEWALGQMEFPESNVRAEPRPEPPRPEPLREWVQIWTDWVFQALLAMGLEDKEQVMRRAQGLVQAINIEYRPGIPFVLPPPTIVRIGLAISAWRKDMDYVRLQKTVEELLFARKDLLFLFETFLPARLRAVTREEAMRQVQGEALAPKLQRE